MGSDPERRFFLVRYWHRFWEGPLRALVSPPTRFPPVTLPSPFPWVRVVLGLIVAALVAYAAYSFFTGPQRRAAEQLTTKVEVAGSKAAADTAETAIKSTERLVQNEMRIHEITRETRDVIYAQPGATDQINPALADAARARLCLRPIFANDPACAQLRQIHPADDAGRGSPPSNP